ncbi:MAG TPA: GIY-YIG nuclease family protein [bacterium]|nr:GIY-YIG nuclease family protein [bacterium]
MSYYLYILQSKKNGRFYIGQTKDIQDRLQRHNVGHSKSTKPHRPWELVYSEEYSTRSEAVKREYKLKSKKSRKYIEYLIEKQDTDDS